MLQCRALQNGRVQTKNSKDRRSDCIVRTGVLIVVCMMTGFDIKIGTLVFLPL